MHNRAYAKAASWLAPWTSCEVQPRVTTLEKRLTEPHGVASRTGWADQPNLRMEVDQHEDRSSGATVCTPRYIAQELHAGVRPRAASFTVPGGGECHWPPSDAAVTGHSFPEYKMPVPWGRTPERGSWYSDLQLALLGYSSQGD